MSKFQRDRKVWIIGNGPSLRDFDFSVVDASDIVLVCNYFCLNEFSSDVKITFYCTSDPRLFESDEFLSRVGALDVGILVMPLRQAFKRSVIRYKKRKAYYNYIPYFKLWNEELPLLSNDSIFIPLQSGDTVAFDVMVPLALSLRPKSVEFVGIDLEHSGGVQHSYDEALATGPRSSDNYLKGQWMDNTSQSLRVLMGRTRLGKVLERSEFQNSYNQVDRKEELGE